MKLATAFLLLSQTYTAHAGTGSKDSLPVIIDDLQDADISTISAGESCLNMNGFTVSVEHCNFDALSHAIEQLITLECPHADGDRELQYIFGEDKETTEEAVKAACKTAWQNHVDKYEYPWASVSGYGAKWDKEYYDGNSNWNEVYETIVDAIDPDDPGNHLKDDAYRVESLYEGEAQYYPIGYPDDLENFDDCKYRSIMCCWTSDRQANDNNGNCKTPYDDNCVDADPGDNTDLCSVNMDRSPEHNYVDGGFAFFRDNNNDNVEGPIHCHGLAWGEDEMEADARYKANNLFYVSMYDHMHQRGYVRNVPGAPMCGCVEKMPKVSRSDCTEIDAEEQWLFTWDTASGSFTASLESAELDFNACTGPQGNNNLESFYKRLEEEDRVTFEEYYGFKETIVGNNNCKRTIERDIVDAGFEYVPAPYKMGDYTLLPGSLRSVNVSGDGKVLLGVATDGTLMEYKDGAWESTDDNGEKFQDISLTEDGSSLWGVTRSGDVYLRKAGDWIEFERRLLKSISVSADGAHVYALNDDGQVFYRPGEDGYWEEVTGNTDATIMQLSVNDDGQNVWAIDNQDKVYYRAGPDADNWTKKDGKLVQLSAYGTESLWGVNENSNVYTRANRNSGYSSKNGYLRMITTDSAGSVVYGVDKYDRVWKYGTSADVQMASFSADIEDESDLVHFYEDGTEKIVNLNIEDPVEYEIFMGQGEEVELDETTVEEEYTERAVPGEGLKNQAPPEDPQPEVSERVSYVSATTTTFDSKKEYAGYMNEESEDAAEVKVEEKKNKNKKKGKNKGNN